MLRQATTLAWGLYALIGKTLQAPLDLQWRRAA
jgi:hypothetical protein